MLTGDLETFRERFVGFGLLVVLALVPNFDYHLYASARINDGGALD
jgi:hypothetical protein